MDEVYYDDNETLSAPIHFIREVFEKAGADEIEMVRFTLWSLDCARLDLGDEILSKPESGKSRTMHGIYRYGACSVGNALTVEKSAMRSRTIGVEGAFQSGYVGCIEPDCATACPSGALTPREGGGVKFEKDRCINCGACVKACVPRALQWDLEELRPIVCHHCGICAAFCPNNVLALVEVEK